MSIVLALADTAQAAAFTATGGVMASAVTAIVAIRSRSNTVDKLQGRMEHLEDMVANHDVRMTQMMDALGRWRAASDNHVSMELGEVRDELRHLTEALTRHRQRP